MADRRALQPIAGIRAWAAPARAAAHRAVVEAAAAQREAVVAVPEGAVAGGAEPIAVAACITPTA
jgi:hypothetical protein